MGPLIFCSVLYISVWSCSPLNLNFFFFTGSRCSQKAQLLHRGFVGEFWPTKNSALQQGWAPLWCSSEHQRKHRIQGSFLIVIRHFVTWWQSRSEGFPFLPKSIELSKCFCWHQCCSCVTLLFFFISNTRVTTPLVASSLTWTSLLRRTACSSKYWRDREPFPLSKQTCPRAF